MLDQPGRHLSSKRAVIEFYGIYIVRLNGHLWIFMGFSCDLAFNGI